MKNSIKLLYLFAFAFLAGCSNDAGRETNPLTSGAFLTDGNTDGIYIYTAYSRNGVPVVRGRLVFSRIDSVRVLGRWRLRALGDTTRIGPQHGRGSLVGHLQGSALYINLNPGNADNTVLLNGELRRRGYFGRWEWVGFPGVLNGGMFRAVRSSPGPDTQIDSFH
jgi:hypothetical protein